MQPLPLLLLLCFFLNSVESQLVVTVNEGIAQGFVESGIRKFLAIPYAAPPVGNLRWRKPQPPLRWSGIRQFSTSGAQCPQSPCVPEVSTLVQSEDCLTLNVFAPITVTRPLPVRVWFHGGGYGVGNAYEIVQSKVLDASAIVNDRDHPAIVVTVQYRLGALGFLSLPSAFPEANGTLGLQDQQKALSWIQDNIAAFGGDPATVVIWGESAGGGSVMHHLVMPSSWPLFKRAIVESGWVSNVPRQTKSAALAQGSSLATALGCSIYDFTCLLSKSFLQVESAITLKTWFLMGSGAVFVPVEDGDILTANAFELFNNGLVAPNVDVLIGTNLNEGTMFVYETYAFGLTEGTYYGAVNDKYGATLASPIVSMYPSIRYGGQRPALAQAITDGSFVCPMKVAVDGLSRAGVSTYVYLFQDSSSNLAPLGVYHGSDTFFFFGQPYLFWTTGQAVLSQVMRTYVASFVETGVPSGVNLPMWPRYSESQPTRIIFDEVVSQDFSMSQLKQTCDFWNPLILASTSA